MQLNYNIDQVEESSGTL